jgi:uncharacterized protein
VDAPPPDVAAPPASAVPEAPPAPAPPPPPISKSGLAFFGLVLALFVGPGAVAQQANAFLGLAWSCVFTLLVPAALAASGSNLDVGRALGLARRPPGRLLGLALLVGGAGFFAAGALMALGSLLLPRGWLDVFDVARLFQGSPLQRLALALLAATLAPLCEEVAFRGWLLSALRTRLPTRAALALSGLLFGLMHLDPVRFPALVALGAVFAWLTWRSGSIWPAILAHVTNNAIGLALAASGSASTNLAAARSRPGQVAASALVLIALAGSALAVVLVAFRAATPFPPPVDEVLVRRDPAEPSTSFRLARGGRGLALALAAAGLTWLPLAARALRHLPRRR